MNNPQNELYVSRITELDEKTQETLSALIQEVMFSMNATDELQGELIDLENEDFRDFDELVKDMGEDMDMDMDMDMYGELDNELDKLDQPEVGTPSATLVFMQGGTETETDPSSHLSYSTETLNNYINTLKQQLEAERRRVDVLERSGKDLQRKLAEACDREDQHQEEIQRLQEEKKRMGENIESLQKEVESSKNALVLQLESNKELRQRAEVLEKESVDLKQEVNSLQNETQYARVKNDEMGSTTEMLMAELVQARQSESSLQQTVKQLHGRLEIREQELEKVKERYKKEIQQQREQSPEQKKTSEWEEERKKLQGEVKVYKARLEEVCNKW